MKTFAIKFRDGRYFITSSDDPNQTMKEFTLRGFDPITVESLIDNAESYHEWALFRDYLGLYGIDKVRSETFPNWDLTNDQRRSLNNFIGKWTSSNRVNEQVSIEKLCGAFHEVKLCYAETGSNTSP